MKRSAGLVLEALLTLWLLATLCFVLLRAAPGGPFDAEKAAPPEVQAALDAGQYGATVNATRSFNANAQVSTGSSVDYPIDFSPVGPTGAVQFQVGAEQVLTQCLQGTPR